MLTGGSVGGAEASVVDHGPSLIVHGGTPLLPQSGTDAAASLSPLDRLIDDVVVAHAVRRDHTFASLLAFHCVVVS